MVLAKDRIKRAREMGRVRINKKNEEKKVVMSGTNKAARVA